MNADRKSPHPDYGDWKFPEEIELSDLMVHPIWIDCMLISMFDGVEDSPLGGDESSKRPVLNSTNVRPELRHALILLKVEDSDYWADALYDCAQNTLSCIAVYSKDGARIEMTTFRDPLTYVSIPSLNSISNQRFIGRVDDHSEATAKN